MYIVRDIFQLKFGHFRDAKMLFDQAKQKNMFPETNAFRILSDFTGESYRLILEMGFDTLGDYEKSMTSGMGEADWKKWYEDFKQHVVSSYREILKEV
ncbi:MAG TPA: hypothetical protein VK498_15740 [Ferruginibacter sp.]|nr:hypothetical protein [Ferruginibacter sp.]